MMGGGWNSHTCVYCELLYCSVLLQLCYFSVIPVAPEHSTQLWLVFPAGVINIAFSETKLFFSGSVLQYT
jgi:hypothetical protein